MLLKNSPGMRRVGALAGIAIAATLLAGCGSDIEENAAGGSAAADAESADVGVTPAEEETPAALSPTECLVGTWLSDNDLFLAQLDEIGEGVIDDVTGNVFVTYEGDGSMKLDYQDWLITSSAEGVTVTIHRHGVDEGEYSATDTELTFRDTVIGSTTTVSGPGMNMSIDPEPAGYSNAPYTCGPEEITLTTLDGEVKMMRQ